MANSRWELAEQLASRGYNIEFEVDKLSDGTLVYMARNPELPGCKAQGATIEEAKANLDETRIDYIDALLEEGISIPQPFGMAPNTKMQGGKSSTTSHSFNLYGSNELEDVLSRVARPTEREFLYGIQLGGDLIVHD